MNVNKYINILNPNIHSPEFIILHFIVEINEIREPITNKINPIIFIQ